MIKKVNKGILFWIEGFSGSGKTTLAKKIKSKINKLYGPTILINGDDIRSIFKLNDFSKLGRLNVFKKYVLISRLITNQKINLIFTVVGLNKKYQYLLKKKFKNIITILIKTNIHKVSKMKIKKTYEEKENIVGLNIKPDYPKYEIILVNNFKKNLDKLSLELINKIKKKLPHK
tara:strand:+ start:180 stop:701 length:522 start_codon:yes stop_codon:yes gene_type:complete